MAQANLHQELQRISDQIQAAQQAVLQAQGTDSNLLQQAHQQLQQAEDALESTRIQVGTEATDNPQFQQASEELHDIRQQVQEAQQNNSDVL
ncbi:hypothetical protein GCM10011351_12820 [Paraliobacillus quinghaiensis]|uniref:Uncharacterized protein n=1 Tax=Paraliobacillus quinghaiensis TaxID=470815 RepID=A0A917WTY1_9BACI|nr:hypothetical protein [Paraliobacillus quinghaiensis]GGM28344.1 hypothetical protein GCM10011351_12820 [Paraliobacillus quinghaiensis]